MAPQQLAQDGVIDAGKVLAHIQPQHQRVAAAELLQTQHRPMRAPAHAVGVTLRQKQRLETRLDAPHQRVMHDAILKRRGADPTAFAFMQGKVAIWARPPNLRAQPR